MTKDDEIKELKERVKVLENLIKQINHMTAGPIPTVEEKGGHMPRGEDTSFHEWNFGHPYRGTTLKCWTCEKNTMEKAAREYYT